MCDKNKESDNDFEFLKYRLEALEKKIYYQKNSLHSYLNNLFIMQAFLFAGLIGTLKLFYMILQIDNINPFVGMVTDLLIVIPAVGIATSLLYGITMTYNSLKLYKNSYPSEKKLNDLLEIPIQERTPTGKKADAEFFSVCIFCISPWILFISWFYIMFSFMYSN